MSEIDDQVEIWRLFKPRHTHAWNMLKRSWDELRRENTEGFEIEYCWENFIIRLVLYRTTVKTLTKMKQFEEDANRMIDEFDQCFISDAYGTKRNFLTDVRNIIEHFDDYAAGQGNNKIIKPWEIDTWRELSTNEFTLGEYSLEADKSYLAAQALKFEVHVFKDNFMTWYKSTK